MFWKKTTTIIFLIASVSVTGFPAEQKIVRMESRVFPDAIVLCTHRDPVAVTQSMATMIAYSARTSKRPESIKAAGRYWIDRVEIMFEAYIAGRDLIPDEQGMDVLFPEANDENTGQA